MRAVSCVAVVLVAVSAGLGAFRSQDPALGGGTSATTAGQRCSVTGIKSACATVWVTADGQLELNGRPADLGQIDEAFGALVASRGVVVYAREAAQGEPHPKAMTIMDLIVKRKLPVTMSTKRDFSDVVGPDGRPRPRQAS